MPLSLNFAITKSYGLHFAGPLSIVALMLSAITPVACAQSRSHELTASDAPTAWSNWVSEGKALITAGNYVAASQAFRKALTVAKASAAGDWTLIELHDALASAYAEAGQYAESEHEYRRALAIAEKATGRKSLEYALLVASMAALPTQIGHREPVVRQLREAVAANGRTGSARELVIVRLGLAQVLMDARKYVEAEPVFLDAQFTLAGLNTPDSKLMAELFNGLGVLRFRQGRYSESINLYQDSLRLFEGAGGDEHPSLVAPLNNLALSYLKLGRLNDAELILRRANALCGSTLGEDHATCGVILEGYAVVLRKLNRKREAKVVAARSQQIARASRSRNGIGFAISVTALRTNANPVP